MTRMIWRSIALFCSMLLAFQCLADERATPDEAAAMVHRVIADMKATSRDAVIAEINTLSSKYRDRDLYVTILDMKGKEIAHGSNRRMQGVDLIDLKDTEEKPFIKERIDIAKAKGKGWQDYNFVNPVTKQIEPKSVYFEKFEDLVVSCGAYKSSGAPSH